MFVVRGGLLHQWTQRSTSAVSSSMLPGCSVPMLLPFLRRYASSCTARSSLSPSWFRAWRWSRCPVSRATAIAACRVEGFRFNWVHPAWTCAGAVEGLGGRSLPCAEPRSGNFPKRSSYTTVHMDSFYPDFMRLLMDRPHDMVPVSLLMHAWAMWTRSVGGWRNPRMVPDRRARIVCLEARFTSPAPLIRNEMTLFSGRSAPLGSGQAMPEHQDAQERAQWVQLYRQSQRPLGEVMQQRDAHWAAERPVFPPLPPALSQRPSRCLLRKA